MIVAELLDPRSIALFLIVCVAGCTLRHHIIAVLDQRMPGR